MLRRKKRGPVRSKKKIVDGIEFKSGLEAYMYKALKEAGKTDSFLYQQSVSVTEGRGLLDKEPSWIDADAMAKELMDEKDG